MAIISLSKSFEFSTSSFITNQQIMAAVDGWVNDVEDVLSKAESAYRQITPETLLEDKRTLLVESRKLVFAMYSSELQMNEAKDNLDALAVQIKKLPRESQFNYLNVRIRRLCECQKKTAFSERIKVLQSDLKFQFQSMERKDLFGEGKTDGVEGGDMLIQHALQVGNDV